MRDIVSPLAGFASPFGPQRGFNPLRIFANDEPGVWFEANDANTLFTDVAGTTPVTSPGDAVALQLDKSQGAGYAGGSFTGLGPELVTNGDFSTGDLTGWTIASWTVIDEQAVGSSGGAALQPSPAITIEAGKTYQVTFTVISSPFLSVNFGGVFLGSIWPSGTYTRLVKAVTTANLSFAAGGGSASTIDNISVRELPGNHRTQATTAARPLYALHPVGGVRNLLEYTEDLTALPGSVRFAVSLSDGITSPVGNSTLVTLLPGTASRIRYSPTGLSAGETYTASAYLNANDSNFFYFEFFGYGLPRNNVWFDIANGTVGTQESDIDNATIESFGNGWYRVSATITLSADAVGEVYLGFSTADNSTASASGSMYLDGPQLEQSSTATNYQRVGSFLDVSEEGKARRGRIWYNGTSHFMQTGTITPGTDKAQVFAGVRNNNTTASAVVELSQSAAINNGVFIVAARENLANYFFASKGTTSGEARTGATFPAPTTNILTALGDISGDSAILRIDGVQEATSTTDQGTGNYLAYPLYFGARNGTSLFFNGYEDTSIIRFGPNLDDTTISKVESYVASKTPEPTL